MKKRRKKLQLIKVNLVSFCFNYISGENKNLCIFIHTNKTKI
jgi:hypothetical protein